jgi:hypothetical protein
MLKKAPTKTRQSRAIHFEEVPVSAIKAVAACGTAPQRRDDPAVELTVSTRIGERHFHAVQFYESPDALCRIVGSFIGEALTRGAAAVLIVTPDHATRIDACLRESGYAVDELKEAGALVIADARDMLNEFMFQGMPNPSAFRRTVGGLLAKVRRGKGNLAVCAYGEMVDLLWKDGREGAAIRLETLWNQLARMSDFDLLCGYSMGNFYKTSALDDIKRQHTHLYEGTA